ncbi:MAG: RCC1 domain-containing protein, partial [Polyangiaceae bacterium]
MPSSTDAAAAAADIGNERAALEAGTTRADGTGQEAEAAGNDAVAAFQEAAEGDANATGVSDAGAPSAVTVVAVGNTSTCAVTVAGQLVCLGMFQYDPSGSLAVCPANQDCFAPQVLAGLPAGVTSVAAGYKSICAVLSDGRVACWGEASSGIAPPGSITAVVIPNLSGVTSLSVGYGPLSPNAGAAASACAVGTGGAVECWGSGPVVNSMATPVPIAGLSSGVTAVSVGTSGACAITSGGGVTCWGEGEFVRPTNPVQVADSSTGATALSVGTNVACLVASGGNVMC